MTSQELISYIENDLLLGSHPDPVTDDTELVLSGLLDSIALMRLVAHIDKTHGIKIPEDGLLIENFSTPAAICNYAGSLG